MALLVHQELGRAEALVQALNFAGFKMAIHVDAKVGEDEYNGFYQSVGGLESVVFVPRIKCDWGRFSLVEAQISTAKTLLDHFSDVSHVMQVSGACLPNRPLGELQEFLANQPDTDFIESVQVGGVNWSKGGLEAERFSLYFPFSFIGNKPLFDIFVKVQRLLRIKRKIPKGLTPHIGSQWWALSRATLRAILDDPERPLYDRYFAQCWIPDESYFQTLVRKHSHRIKCRSLTFSRFDFRGKPMVLYDDHQRFIEHFDSFFVRKIWPGAQGLYDRLLAPDREGKPRNPDMEVAFQAQTKKAESRFLEGRAGLVMQSRAPAPSKLEGAAPYTVLSGFDYVFKGLPLWLLQHTGVVLHEHLFSNNWQAYNEAKNNLRYCLGTNLKIRDFNQEGFLQNFVWNQSDTTPLFNFDPGSHPDLAAYIAKDPQARIFHIRSAWLLGLLRDKPRDIEKIGPLVQAYTLKEQIQLRKLVKGKARVQIISLAEIFEQPGVVLEDLIFSLRPTLASQNRELPEFYPHEGLEEYIDFLKDAGLNLRVEAAQNTDIAGQGI
ncbi:MAG: beta-1,6-N-acetylglucosaminyltransferase [Rhodobacteraceae bacterium]|nr:beta-1,6-N-acetylglucosaminyltransferase [Paracoccaceae bacterium]